MEEDLKVADLINPTTNQWVLEVLQGLLLLLFCPFRSDGGWKIVWPGTQIRGVFFL
jgi:hypothetical protein